MTITLETQILGSGGTLAEDDLGYLTPDTDAPMTTAQMAEAFDQIANPPKPLSINAICRNYLSGDLPWDVYRALEKVYDHLATVRRDLTEGREIELYWRVKERTP